MKKILKITILVIMGLSYANAGDRYQDLTYDYFYGKKNNVSVNVRLTIAKDEQTSPKVLEILTHDENVAVWLLAKDNLEKKYD